MRIAPSLLAATLALGALAAGPVVSQDVGEQCFLVAGAGTETTDDDVSACRQDVWFHQQGEKADNLDHVQGETYASFDTAPPSSSVTDGAGSGTFTTSVLHQQADAWDTTESFVTAGTFTGALDNVVVELYMFRPGLTPSINTGDPSGATVGGDIHSVDAALYINGYQIATLDDVDAKLQPAGEAAERFVFVFEGLMPTLQLLTEDIEGEHTIEVRTHGTGFGSDSGIVVYDTTEVPSGMIFNAPADLVAEIHASNTAE